MKCPKCGFNSFESLDNCKKCGNALTPFKQNLGIRAVILPSRQASAPPSPAAPSPAAPSPPADVTTGRGEEDFSFVSPPEPAGKANENDSTFGEFTFAEADEPMKATPVANGNGFDGDQFADLLESGEAGGTWSGEAGPATFGELSTSEFEGFSEAFSFDETASGANHAPPASPAEFDLDAFTFEADSPSPMKAPSGGATDGPVTDEFDSLFGAPEPDKH